MNESWVTRKQKLHTWSVRTGTTGTLSMSAPTTQGGRLEVQILQARQLAAMDRHFMRASTSDPYVIIKVGSTASHMGQSCVLY